MSISSKKNKLALDFDRWSSTPKPKLSMKNMRLTKVDYIALYQFTLVGNPVADHLIHRSTRTSEEVSSASELSASGKERSDQRGKYGKEEQGTERGAQSARAKGQVTEKRKRIACLAGAGVESTTL